MQTTSSKRWKRPLKRPLKQLQQPTRWQRLSQGKIWIVIGLGLVCLLLPRAAPVWAADPVARAILFYSPSCPHCHQVMTEDLPLLLASYESQFEVVAANVTSPEGQALYQAAINHFAIPPERQGVPTLIIGDHVLVGSLEIPEQLPGLIDAYLSAGGVDWPAIPGLAAALATAAPTALAPTVTPVEPTTEPTITTAIATVAATATSASNTPTPEPVQTASPTPTALPVTAAAGDSSAGQVLQIRELTASGPDGVFARFQQDLAGNALSVLVLVGMVAALFTTTARWRQADHADRRRRAPVRWQQAAAAGLILVGLGISVYMAYIETTQATAVCGPVGDCNTVQQSQYARLFAVMPIGVIGVIGYAALGLAWIASRFRRDRLGHWARLLLAGMALAGTLFSVYLTFLEPFVIGASCLWCLSSAVTITLILLLTVDQGQRALATLAQAQSGPPRQHSKNQA